MNGPAVVSISRIAAALRTWPQLVETLADSGDAAGELACYISVFGHGGGVPEGIGRVRGAVATGGPARFEDLYKTRPRWLADAHAALDAAVAAAYGWSADISDDDALRDLLALNGSRA